MVTRQEVGGGLGEKVRGQGVPVLDKRWVTCGIAELYYKYT